jgi:hypothetical protein
VTTTPSDVVPRLAGGLAAEDRSLVDHHLRRSLARLADRRGVTAELSVKDRGRPQMLTTLEVWLPRLPRLVATSTASDLATALSEIDRRIVVQLDELLTRRQPKASRRRRSSIRDRS